ncbi:putative SnoaL-like aldol condensation-catalyzing enzyme [Microbacterium sp. SLBN-154]|uniref:nuclear transport factor 2 family protein n=1 Tax=Microbacterium sp. SLBN-154 TaxID=2768458 RepID=UPI00114E2105|nr:nuclear transport factor 2 family protein [Microbacterium sp. SLBN-154]TQK17716.1 putative SnoaL-like aldol condensation-catalyzing enzyme [Microbacterium sp. SLBN-154]
MSNAVDSPSEVVLDFFRTAFTEQNPREAARRYLSTGYIQHNPSVPDGPEAFVTLMEGLFAQAPLASSELMRTIADGDLVALHYRVTMAPGDRGMAVVDIFRVEAGRIVEHWDVVQPVPEKAANANGMF